MELGTPVLRYQHESNDLGPDLTRDQLALVTEINDTNICVAIFPPLGPITFERLWQFDPDNPYNQPGGIYWREVGAESPNFEEAYKYHRFDEYRALKAKQLKEYGDAATPSRDSLREKHLTEQEELRGQLDEKYPGDNAPKIDSPARGRDFPGAGVRSASPNSSYSRPGYAPVLGPSTGDDQDRRR